MSRGLGDVYKRQKLCSAKKYTRLETVTAFSGILELTRRNKIKAQQERNFGDIIVEKASK